MALVEGLVLGFLLGLGLVFAFAMSENRRAQSREKLAFSTSAFSTANLDGLKKVFAKYPMPTWIVFNQAQKVNWLNHELRRVWPYVDKAASELARTIAEPILEQYKPPLIASLKFNKFTLGTVAPQFVGIKMLDNQENETSMEIEVEWDGNPSIILGVTTTLGASFPVQVKNAAFTGIFRISLKPLAEDLPCFGAIVFALRKQKKLDFKLKVIGGDVSTIPGLPGAIHNMIKSAITDSLLWPARQVIPILPGDYSDLQMKVVGSLHVKLVQAKDLKNKDLIGKSDPFALTFIRPIPSRTKRSKTLNNELDPIWNEKYTFDVEDPSTQELTVQIFDDEGVQASQLLGGVRYPLKDLKPGELQEVWLTLVKDLDNVKEHKYRGQVQIELIYQDHASPAAALNPHFKKRFPLTSVESAIQSSNGVSHVAPPSPRTGVSTPAAPSTPRASSVASPQKNSMMSFHDDEFTRGVLSVTVQRAENLIPADMNGLADPYAVLRMKKSNQKTQTKVIYKTLNPEWNQTFDFVVEDAIHDMLIVEVWDHDTFRKDYLGRSAMTLSKVLFTGDYDAVHELDGVKHGKIFLHMKWTAQPLSSRFP